MKSPKHSMLPVQFTFCSVPSDFSVREFSTSFSSVLFGTSDRVMQEEMHKLCC